MKRPRWDFEYLVTRGGATDDGSAEADLIVATETDIDPAVLTQHLSPHCDEVEVKVILSTHPLYWTRVIASSKLERAMLSEAFERSGARVRYITSQRQGSQALAPSLDWGDARPRRASDWKTRIEQDCPEATDEGSWFLRDCGISLNRHACGTGAGVRIAVIDNDGGGSEHLGLDAEVVVGVSDVPRTSQHSTLLIAWATGTRPNNPLQSKFCGVAPDASPRLYCIPKPSDEVLHLPLAVVHAVDDGADVVVCATHVEGQTSPMLDDALEFAWRLGRGGRGTAVVMPTGRDVTSTAGSAHASLTLRFGDPACDPRVFCVGPSARNGEWFLWRDRHGKLRPFANRGPSVRWLAPGDDVAYPLSDDGPTLAHAESSGASGIAAGVIALVLANNGGLSLNELEQTLTGTARVVTGVMHETYGELADPYDVLPTGRDADGHNPKHGYGRLSVDRACAIVTDPVAATLIRLGEEATAYRWLALRQTVPRLKRLYTREFASTAARILTVDANVAHAAAALMRHARLISQAARRRTAQYAGSAGRQLGLVLRLMGSAQLHIDATTRAELHQLLRQVEESTRTETAGSLEEALYALGSRVFTPRPSLAGAA